MTSELRTFEQFQKSLRSFGWVAEAGVTGASDVDLMLERRGHFLFLEGKPREGPQISVALGQFIALRALAGQPNTTVWIVAEDEDAKEDAVLPRYSLLEVKPGLRYHKEGWRAGAKQAIFYTDSSMTHMTLAQLQAAVQQWWERSSQ